MIWIEGEYTKPLHLPAPIFKTTKGIHKEKYLNTSTQQTKLVPKSDFINYLSNQAEKSISQLATLYLLTNETTWLNKFKKKLLTQASENKDTSKTGSIKYSQTNFMYRALYLYEINKKSPGFFTQSEMDIIVKWFEAGTERIFTPEWVDYLYAIPFRDNPSGPYLNQEVGAGAISALQLFIKNKKLKNTAQIFLENKTKGFSSNFRNPDDSIEYQNIWIQNAFTHFLYYLKEDQKYIRNIKNAIKWITTQLPKEPIPFEYGLPNNSRPLASLAISSFYLKNEEDRLRLDRHLNEIINNQEDLPKDLYGFWLWDDSVNLVDLESAQNYTIISGTTGYAFKPGQLQPDKVVLKQSSRQDNFDHYFIIVNLRSSGWHRYPSTNTIIRMEFNGYTLLSENIIKKKHNWLPAGRAKHRDKKVDRSRLNGLQIKRTGLDAWIGDITGIYSTWRQDVPHYSIAKFISNNTIQISTKNWLKTNHNRLIKIINKNHIVIIDEIISERPEIQKEITWHTQALKKKTNLLLSNKSVKISFISPNNVKVSHAQINNLYPYAYKDARPDRKTSIQLEKVKRNVIITSISGINYNIDNDILNIKKNYNIK